MFAGLFEDLFECLFISWLFCLLNCLFVRPMSILRCILKKANYKDVEFLTGFDFVVLIICLVIFCLFVFVSLNVVLRCKGVAFGAVPQLVTEEKTTPY